MMKLPRFLIIGAMKAGTTTLYQDLGANPRIFFPRDKEPNSLLDDAVLTEAGLRDYAAMFARAADEQICGEASTAYTKHPVWQGAARRARQVLGPDLKLIYIIREPVARIISHHHHDYSLGAMPIDIDQAVRDDPAPIAFSRYWMQLEPWLEAFGAAAVRVVQFEKYMPDRREGVRALSKFLGVPPRPELIKADEIFNKSEGKPVTNAFWEGVKHTWLYQHLLRHTVPPAARRWFFRVFLPKAPPRPAPPSAATVDYIIAQVRDDAEAMRRFLGLDQPLWDFQAVRRRYAEKRTPLST